MKEDEEEAELKIILRKTRIDGAKKKKNDECENQKLFLCTRKFISYHLLPVLLLLMSSLRILFRFASLASEAIRELF